jgi:hypothetical protein
MFTTENTEYTEAEFESDSGLTALRLPCGQPLAVCLPSAIYAALRFTLFGSVYLVYSVVDQHLIGVPSAVKTSGSGHDSIDRTPSVKTLRI